MKRSAVFDMRSPPSTVFLYIAKVNGDLLFAEGGLAVAIVRAQDMRYISK